MKFFGILFSSILLSYIYVINGDFLGDDVGRILFNQELLSYKSALTGDLGDRPFLMLIMTFISKVFGVKTVYYRLFGIFVHALVSYQLYKFILELNFDSNAQNKNLIAKSVAMVFALHPLHSQMITTTIQSGVTLSALFGMEAIKYFYRGLHYKKNYICSIGSFFLGILFKPNLSFIPIFFSIYHEKIRTSLVKKIVLIFSFFLLLLLPVGFYLLLEKNIQHNAVSPLQYFFIQTEAVFVYFKLMLVPVGLKYLYDFYPPQDILSNSYWSFFIAHILFILTVLKLLKDKLLRFLFIGFYISFLPESSFFPIKHFAFEHRTYFPMIYLFLFIGTAIIKLNFKIKYKRLFMIFIIGICSIYFVLNQIRNFQIKYYGTWGLHTLENTISDHFANFALSISLARGNVFEVEKFIDNYNIVYPDHDYKILKEAYNYYFDKYHKKDISKYLVSFCYALRNPALRTHTRYYINKLILSEFAHDNDNIEQLVLIEKTLSFQMRILFQRKDYYKDYINNYLTLTAFLMSEPLGDKFKGIDYANYLKAKAILFYYFGKKYENLESEIMKELEKDPKSEVLIKSIELIKQKKI